MPADEYLLRHYQTANGKDPFGEWLWFLADRNRNVWARVETRLDRYDWVILEMLDHWEMDYLNCASISALDTAFTSRW